MTQENIPVIFCSACGQKNEGGANFCAKCGKQIASTVTAQSPSPGAIPPATIPEGSAQKSSGIVTAMAVVGFVFGLIGMLGSFIPIIGIFTIKISIGAAIISGLSIALALSLDAKRTFPIVALTVSLIGVGMWYVQIDKINSATRTVKELTAEMLGNRQQNTTQASPSPPAGSIGTVNKNVAPSMDSLRGEEYLRGLEQYYQNIPKPKEKMPDTPEAMRQWYKGFQNDWVEMFKKSPELSKAESLKTFLIVHRIATAKAGFNPAKSFAGAVENLSKDINFFIRCNDDIGIGYCKFNDMDGVRTIETSGKPLEYFFYPDEIKSAKTLIRLIKKYNGISETPTLPPVPVKATLSSIEPFGFKIGVTTLDDVRRGLPQGVNFSVSGTNVYSQGPAASAFGGAFAKDGLSDIAYLSFNERNILSSVSMTIRRNEFYDVYKQMERKAHVLKKPNLSGDNLEARFKTGDVIIEMSSYRSDPTEVRYMYSTSEFFQRYQKSLKGHM